MSLCFVQISLYFVSSLLRIGDSNGDAMGAMDDSDESNNAITIISNESEVGIDASALLSQVLIVASSEEEPRICQD